MTPEERAKEAISDWHLLPSMGSFNGDLNALIAQAIRQAENDKLEEAASAAIGASRGMSCFVGMDDCQLFNQGVRAAEQAVLSLKIPKD